VPRHFRSSQATNQHAPDQFFEDEATASKFLAKLFAFVYVLFGRISLKSVNCVKCGA
jgi:hypothetical protein